MKEVSTYVNHVPYARVVEIKETIHEALRHQLRSQYDNLDWETEVFTQEFHKGSRKCEDMMLVTLKVEEIDGSID